MILLFLLKAMNILATDCIEAFLEKNELNERRNEGIEPLWTSTLLNVDMFEGPIEFEEDLCKDNRILLDPRNFEESEKFLFYILNYNADNKEIHDQFFEQFISNVIVNVFNPTMYDWAKIYVKYVISRKEIFPNIRIINNNIINLITDQYSVEWTFSKILCRDADTLSILESLFSNRMLEAYSQSQFFDFFSRFTTECSTKMNLFVVYLEILKHLKIISNINVYYYELSGVSTYSFGLLSMFTSYRAYKAFNSTVPNHAFETMSKMQEAMLILYYCVRVIEYRAHYGVNFMTENINELISKCLQKVGGCTATTINKAFECIDMIRKILRLQINTKRTTDFFNHLRTYILPFSLYSEKYIDDLYSMLKLEQDVPTITVSNLSNDIEDFYKLTMFLVT
jgi:hypothetical protein